MQDTSSLSMKRFGILNRTSQPEPVHPDMPRSHTRAPSQYTYPDLHPFFHSAGLITPGHDFGLVEIPATEYQINGGVAPRPVQIAVGSLGMREIRLPVYTAHDAVRTPTTPASKYSIPTYLSARR